MMNLEKINGPDHVRRFSEQTTVHGLQFLGLPKLHLLERFFWTFTVLAATGGAIAISYSNWMRYLANPTVVSLQKDFRNWKNPFPAVTGCFLNKVDENFAETYILEKWGVKPDDKSYSYYMDFIETVANISYPTLGAFERFVNDPSLDKFDMFDIVLKVHPPLTGTLVSFDPKHKSKWILIMSELGICFSVNSKVVNLIGANLSKSGTNILKSDNEDGILHCYYLNGLCYARYDSDPKLSLQFYVHSPLDSVYATSGLPITLQHSEELEINYRMQETDSSVALRDLRPSQRRCRFFDEPITNDLPVYSTSMCYIHCRYKIAMKLCGCRPFFYHYFGGKLCNLKGLVCLSKNASYIMKPTSEIGCKCPQPCNLITYIPQVPKFTKWEFGYFDQRITFRWGLLPPTTKYHRDILFGFQDLVVSFGGTLALFLGVSFISGIEFFFLISEGIWGCWKKMQETRKSRTPII